MVVDNFEPNVKKMLKECPVVLRLIRPSTTCIRWHFVLTIFAIFCYFVFLVLYRELHIYAIYVIVRTYCV